MDGSWGWKLQAPVLVPLLRFQYPSNSSQVFQENMEFSVFLARP